MEVSPQHGMQSELTFSQGIWAIDFADEHPEAEIVGTDLSPIQPTWVPPNVKFYVDDVEGEWAYQEDEAFDLIHVRGMVGAIADWKLLFQRMRDHTKRGGLVEVQEYEGWLYSSKDFSHTKIHQWQVLGNEASSKFGKDINMARKLKPLMEECGFVDVQEKIVKVCQALPREDEQMLTRRLLDPDRSVGKRPPQ